MNYQILPEHCREGMHLYIEHGVIPGGFLQAVICNEPFMDVIGRADTVNMNMLSVYARFLYNEAPRASWGSRETMMVWHKQGGLAGHPEDAP